MKHKLLPALAAAFLLLTGSHVMGQQKIGGTAGVANANAFLELDASGTAKKGLLNARLTLSSTSSPSPLSAHVAGMLVYNTAAAGSGSTQVYPGLYYNDGSQWVFLNDWHVTGNTGTTPSSSAVGAAVNGNYWGTTDAQNLVVGVNGQNRMIFDQNYNATGGGPASSTAASSYNFSWGTGNTITSRHSVAFGNNNNINGNAWNAAIGNSNSISGLSAGSAAIGSGNTITGSAYSYTFGTSNSTSTNNYNVSFGNNNTSTGGSNFVFGGSNNVPNSSCLVVGSNIISGAEGQFILSPIGTVPITSSTVASSFSGYFPGGYRFVVGNALTLGTSAQVNIRKKDIPISGVPSIYSGTYMGIGDTTAMLFTGAGNPTTGTGSATNGLHSTLQVAGSFAARIRTLNGTYTLREDDYTVVATGSLAAITLPNAAGCTGRIYIILNEHTATIAVNTSTNQARYGSTLASSFSISASTTVGSASGRITVQSDGSVWHLIGN